VSQALVEPVASAVMKPASLPSRLAIWTEIGIHVSTFRSPKVRKRRGTPSILETWTSLGSTSSPACGTCVVRP
jgi:hypothetical protein